MMGLTRAIAQRVVDHLGPADLAAVAFAAFGTNQNFTNDHVALNQAIDSLHPGEYLLTIDATIGKHAAHRDVRMTIE